MKTVYAAVGVNVFHFLGGTNPTDNIKGELTYYNSLADVHNANVMNLTRMREINKEVSIWHNVLF